jgi:dihydrofolate reductase
MGGELVMIAAIGEENGIGRNNKLLWHLPDDFRRFKRLTFGHPMIMGRKTFETFPKPLPGRKHIILTKDLSYTIPFSECIVVHSLEKALEVVAQEPLSFVIGGGEIYGLAMDKATSLEITRVHGTFKADAYFPEISEAVWKTVKETYHPSDQKHAYAFTYLTFIRRKSD